MIRILAGVTPPHTPPPQVSPLLIVYKKVHSSKMSTKRKIPHNLWQSLHKIILKSKFSSEAWLFIKTFKNGLAQKWKV
jgi:hypothetical protein